MICPIYEPFNNLNVLTKEYLTFEDILKNLALTSIAKSVPTYWTLKDKDMNPVF